MFIRNAVLSGLVAMASANTPMHANYDDIKLPPAVDLHPVNTYNGLRYNAFAAIDTGLNGELLTGVKAKTAPNAITTQIVSNVLHGAPYIVSATGSSFTPKELYFGCILATVETAAGVPLSCNLVVHGFDKMGRQVAEQTFAFAPESLLTSDMVKATFNNKFTDVFKLTVSTKAQTSILTSVIYDDFQYDIGHKF